MLAGWINRMPLSIKYKTFKTEPYEFALENQDGIRLKTSTKRLTWSQSEKCRLNWPTGIFKGQSKTTYCLYQSWYIRNDSARSTLAKALLIIWITKFYGRIRNRLVAKMTAQNSDRLNKRRINPSLIWEIQYKRSSSFKQQKWDQWLKKNKN